MEVANRASLDPPSSPAVLREVFEAQQAAFARGAPDYRRRIDALRTLRDALATHREAFARALSADYGGRAREETLLLEIFPLLDQIRHATRHLKSWMKPRRVGSTWFLLPSRAYLVQQPLGVVGVIGAWNYELLLTVGPAIDALAAGNHVIIKPSELVPRAAELLASVVAERFDPEYVAAVTGGPDVGAAFASLPFDHLIFTGSSRVGRLVMGAASDNLTPVTLELGGKSPAIVHEGFPLDVALRRILVGKLYNAGQTCVAPDYLLVPAGREHDVERLANAIVPTVYAALVANPDYTRSLNRAQNDRLASWCDEAAAGGARVVTINPAAETCTVDNRVFPPTLVFRAPPTAALMRNEIFGPILPVVTYHRLRDAIAYVNARPHPLALYYFDSNRRRIKIVVRETISGGVLINDVVVHLGQNNLPFGGVGPSGMGHYHGRHGFDTFSKTKGVMVQSRWPPTKLFAPPFAERQGLIERLLRHALR
jgi:coniferyl-aldehyde dehydrogenase